MLNNINTNNKLLYNTLLKYVIGFIKGVFPYLFINHNSCAIHKIKTQEKINYNKKLVALHNRGKNKVFYQIPNISNNLRYNDKFYTKPNNLTRDKRHISYSNYNSSKNLKNFKTKN